MSQLVMSSPCIFSLWQNLHQTSVFGKTWANTKCSPLAPVCEVAVAHLGAVVRDRGFNLHHIAWLAHPLAAARVRRPLLLSQQGNRLSLQAEEHHLVKLPVITSSGLPDLGPYIATETSGWCLWEVFPVVLPLLHTKIPVTMKKTRSPRKVWSCLLKTIAAQCNTGFYLMGAKWSCFSAPATRTSLKLFCECCVVNQSRNHWKNSNYGSFWNNLMGSFI